MGNITDNGQLFVNHSNDVTFAGVISGSGNLTKNGGDTLILTGTNTYSGVTTISAGTLQLGDGVSDGSVAGNITNNGHLTIDGSPTLVGAISGTGNLTIIDGDATLSGNSTYTGGTEIDGGWLTLGSDSALGLGNLTMSNYTTLEMNGHNLEVKQLNGDVDNFDYCIYDSCPDQTATVQVDNGGYFCGTIAQDDDDCLTALRLTGGTLWLEGNNSFGGGVEIDGGTLNLSNDYALGWGT